MAIKTAVLKCDCRITRGEQVGDQFVVKSGSAFIHLIEVEYAPGVIFWNAALQVTDDSLPVLGVLGPSSQPIGVELPDGRKGFLHIDDVLQTANFNGFAGTGRPNERTNALESLRSKASSATIGAPVEPGPPAGLQYHETILLALVAQTAGAVSFLLSEAGGMSPDRRAIAEEYQQMILEYTKHAGAIIAAEANASQRDTPTDRATGN